MLAISGLLGLVLMGSEPRNGDPQEFVEVRVRVVDIQGVEWRGPIHNALKPAGRQGASTTWTTDRATADAIQSAAERTIAAPTISTSNGVPATVSTGTSTHFVANLERVADGPPGKNSQLAFKPEVETARDGVTAELVCRATAKGTRMEVKIEDSRILAIHTYSIPDSVIDPKTGKTAQAVNAQAQVPEIATCRVEGNWLVPKDGVLVISLGARSSTYDDKKVGVRERVLLIEPSLQKADMGAIKVSRDVVSNWVEANAIRKATLMASSHVSPAPIAVSAAPAFLPVPLPVLSLLASPTVAPRPSWKASLQIAYRATPPIPPQDSVMACLPLSLLNMPLALRNTWIAVAVEPMTSKTLKAATPPTRNLPQWVCSTVAREIGKDSEEAELPPLPDEFVQTASGEIHATGQAPHIVIGRQFDTAIARVSAFVGSGQMFRFKEFSKEEVVLFPAPKAQDETDCLDEPRRRVTRTSMVGCDIAPSSHSAEAEEYLDKVLRDLQATSLFNSIRTDKPALPTDSTPGLSAAKTEDCPHSQAYYVLGEVNTPGRLTATGNETVLDALQSAGGLNAKASINNVRLVRAAKPGSSGTQNLRVDIRAIMQKGDTTTNYRVLPGDQIYVYGNQVAATEKASEPAGMSLPSAFQHRDDVEYFPPGPDFPWANTQDATRRAAYVTRTQDVEPISPDAPVKTLRGSSLSISLKGADGVCESNSEVRLKVIEAQPITLRVPMADGSIVEIQARVVKPANR